MKVATMQRINPFFLAVMLLALVAGCNQKAERDVHAKTKEAPKAVPVLAQTMTPVEFTSHIQATGQALPVRQSFLSSEVPGTIKRILVKEGEQVTKGQALLKFDLYSYSLNVQAAEAGVLAAKTQADLLKLEYDRLKGLCDKNATPQAECDRLKAQYDAAKAQEEVASVQVKKAKKALHDAVLRAPYDGSIVMIIKEEGEHAPAMPPTMLMKIVDSSSLEVQNFLSEEYAGLVKVGDTAEVTIASAGVVTEGEVFFVSDQIEQQTQNFEVRLKVENPDGKIKAGAFARVRYLRTKLPQAILVTTRAIVREGDTSFVFVAEGGKAKKTAVTLGEVQGDSTLIKSGLTAGDKVIVTNVSDLEDGESIKAKIKD